MIRTLHQRTQPRSLGGSVRFLLLGMMASVLTGCSTINTEVGLPLPSDPNALAEGEASVESVVELLGPPTAVSALPDGFVFVYEYSRTSEFQFGISLKAIRMPYFKLIKGNSTLINSILFSPQ